ncbi:MAG: adenosylhomocysteinase, partial [Bacteroidales bacterium]|nr:adenosylhomocysteinase [Bacteroidales bacterium]
MQQPYIVKDISLAPSGQKKIDWVARSMPVLNSLYDKFLKENVFAGKKIALCIHLEAKTAYLALIIQKLEAEVWVTSSNTLSTKDEVCAALARKGVHVFAIHGAGPEEFQSYIKAICAPRLHAIVDDGGDSC